MPAINSEWRIDRIRQIVDTLKQATPDQIDTVTTIVEAYCESYNPGRIRGKRAYALLPQIIDKSPIILGAE